MTAVQRDITLSDTTRSWDMASLRIKTMLLYRAQCGLDTGASLCFFSMMSVITDIVVLEILNFVRLY